MENEFSLVAVDLDEIIANKKKQETDSFYSDIDLDSWSWKNFMQYWDDKYKDEFGTYPTYRQKDIPKIASQVKRAVDTRGHLLFKNMIDWILRNYKRYPTIDYISISLILGSHYWAELIAQNASKINSNKDSFYDD